ncbi:MAG TPA: cytochrome bc complex cytochrome b subunit [bacterium]
MKEAKNSLWVRLTWAFNPLTLKDAYKARVKNFWLHWFPPRIMKCSVSWSYSFWLGTISGVLFFITLVTGIILMFIYIPSVERAYWTIEDLEFVVSFGWVFRYSHRWAGHLMVVAVFLHMMRVFYTGAYKETAQTESYRYVNWIVGVILLLGTLFLAFTGYLLPWDQLAMWAVTVASAIGKTTPVVGEGAYSLLVGGTLIDQPALIRFYTLHCIALPVLAITLVAYHLWRVRKDGGLACVANLTQENREELTVPAVPIASRRFFLVALVTWIVVLIATLLFRAPLLEPADTSWTPNPAKAPWYFLWLQELITFTTIRLGDYTINGGFVGGVFIPGVLFLALAVWPFIDKSPGVATSKWFHSSRLWQNIIFTIICLSVIFLIAFSYYCRGPYWEVYLPWNRPEIPGRF